MWHMEPFKLWRQFFFPSEIENVFFELLLPNTKPIPAESIHGPPSQSDFLEIVNNHFDELNTSNNEIYILGDFTKISLYNKQWNYFQK